MADQAAGQNRSHAHSLFRSGKPGRAFVFDGTSFLLEPNFLRREPTLDAVTCVFACDIEGEERHGPFARHGWLSVASGQRWPLLRLLPA
jgi:hypothetical protein